MRQLTVLLVEPNRAHAGQLRHALGRLLEVTLVQFANGEEAVLWAGANHCDLCILEEKLPGIGGLTTLARLRQRLPDLPAIVLTSSASVQGAIAAFHADILDYLPKQAGFAAAVASLVEQVARQVPVERFARPPLIPPDLPETLFRPTYQNRLRVIGRQLDDYGYASINLLEVSGGFLVRALAPNQRVPEALEFPDRDFPQLVAAAVGERGGGRLRRAASPLVPTGYEDLLRALGERLDRMMAEAIAITELHTVIAVSGVGKVEESNQTRVGPFHQLLRAPEIELMLDEAERRRVIPTAAPSGLMRRLQRNLV
jgi:CheY-like chemotaxis protein